MRNRLQKAGIFFWIDLIEQKQGAGDDLATNRQEPKRRQGVGD
jgi:hypothetical protein